MNNSKYDEKLFGNVTNIQFVVQKQSPRKMAQTHPERTPASFCKCSQFARNCAPGPIQRGEVVVMLTRQVVRYYDKETGESTGWYKRERWRVDCLAKIMILMHNAFSIKNLLQPLKKDMKPGKTPNPLKEIWRLNDEQIEQRRKLQRRAGMYRHRLKQHLENLKPSEKTLKAIANCKIKIDIAETALKAQLTTEAVMESGFQGEDDGNQD